MSVRMEAPTAAQTLNESPSEKEGKLSNKKKGSGVSRSPQ